MTSGLQPPIPDPGPAAAPEWRLASPDGQQQFGPTIEAVFARWVEEGRVKPDWLVWRTGWPQWKTAAEAADQLPDVAPPQPPQPAPPPPEPPAQTARTAPGSPIAKGAVARYRSRRGASARKRNLVAIALAFVTLVLIGLLLWLVTSRT